MSHRWRVFLGALTATALLATVFGIVLSRMAAAGPDAPQLKTISRAALARSGITIAAAPQPPFCGIEQAIAGKGWVQSGSAGCAISRDAAQSQAMGSGGGRVAEAVLARVTYTGAAPSLQNRTAWLVVLQGFRGIMLPAIACAVPHAGAGSASGVCRMPATFALNRVVVVDAFSGQVLTIVAPGLGPPYPRTLPSIRGVVQPGATRPLPVVTAAPAAAATPEVRG